MDSISSFISKYNYIVLFGVDVFFDDFFVVIIIIWFISCCYILSDVKRCEKNL